MEKALPSLQRYDSMYAKNIMKDKRLKEKKGHDGDSDEEYGAGSTMHEKSAQPSPSPSPSPAQPERERATTCGNPGTK